MVNSTAERKPLSVSALNALAKDLLENGLPAMWVEGEISNFSCPSSGHWYFTLKDARSQVRCAMFRSRNTAVRFKPADGQKVTLLANISLYAERGEYQLIVDRIEQSGEGLLRLAFEKLKTQLAGEGLFDTQHKKPLPAWVQHVGVVTSPTGAAVHDILTVLKRRFPAICVSIFPVAVQGKDAAPQIARAIEFANAHSDCDVLIVGRGGGSLEDLWPFNEESVARAIFASRLPIVSAVGHEIDFSIADFVADLRAATPSAAAELISPDQAELHTTFTYFAKHLLQRLQTLLTKKHAQINSLQKRLRHPGYRLQTQAQTLDHLEARLRTAAQQCVRTRSAHISQLHTQLQQHTPAHALARAATRIMRTEERLTTHITHLLGQHNQQLNNLSYQLHLVSPLATLDRGYSILTDTKKHIVSSTKKLKKGDALHARLADGELYVTVKDIATEPR